MCSVDIGKNILDFTSHSVFTSCHPTRLHITGLEPIRILECANKSAFPDLLAHQEDGCGPEAACHLR